MASETIDPEKACDSIKATSSKTTIEHAYVVDDPRRWSSKRKASVVFLTFSTATLIGLGATILNPSIKQIQTGLNATSDQISLTIATYTVAQAISPTFWSAISEIYGRKLVFCSGSAMAIVGFALATKVNSINILIGLRAMQAAGGSVFIPVGAAALADIYDPSERGKVIGILYSAPPFGQALGPIVGGALSQTFSWRINFCPVPALLSIYLLLFVFFFRDTFRKERSLTYRRAVARHNATAQRKARAIRKSQIPPVIVSTTVCGDPGAQAALGGAETKEVQSCLADRHKSPPPILDAAETGVQAITPSLADVNPFPNMYRVVKRLNNSAVLLSSGILFAFNFSILYTASRTLTNAYHYSSLQIGLVLLCAGAGNISGSIIGGYYSDRELQRLIRANGGRYVPEMRLENAKPVALCLPVACFAAAWVIQKRMHVAALCIALFFTSFFSIWIYSGALAYLVDANPGMSSPAAATNSFFRLFSAFVFTEAAVPMQNSLGDGGLYSLWAVIVIICEVLILLVRARGERWRTDAEERAKALDGSFK